jgi:hypothetical protein
VKKLIASTLVVIALTPGAIYLQAQEPSATSAAQETQQRKQENAKRAYDLLDQVISEAQLLRLPENRIRVQFNAADLLWQQNEERARSLFSLASEGLAEMIRSENAPQDQRRGQNQGRTTAQLRQELVLTAARRDAQLAYQLLSATRQLNSSTDPRRIELEQNLEANLLAQVSALDPKLALQNAEQSLDKGEYSRALAEVLARLQQKDKESAQRLQEKIVRKLRTENLLANSDAGTLTIALLQPGPRVNDSMISDVGPNYRAPLLAPSNYQDLLSALIDSALKATPQSATQRRQPATGRGRNTAPPPSAVVQANNPPTLTAAQLEQINARRLLAGLRGMIAQVDQYVPAKASAVRQKLMELGYDATRRPTTSQTPGTTDSLLAAASNAPPAAQSRIYRQAALRALEEGNADRARQIANDYLEPGQREAVLRTVEFRQLADKTEVTRIEDVRATLVGLPSDAERVNLLVRLSENTRKQNPELAVQLLDQAREYTNRRASSYQQFDLQLRLAAAFRTLDSGHGFEVLEPGIMQLNELLSAASVLSGFEVNVFRDGEIPMQGGSRLSDMIRQYGQEIGYQAKNDFERSQVLANRFQYPESRIVARLAIVRALLEIEPTPTNDRRFARGGEDVFRQ